jgi:integrase
MTRGRPFGSMRVLPSGRVQVRYYGPDGLRHKAPVTFGTKTEARRWLSMMEADLARGRWNGDDSDGERLETYAARWISERPGLSERSVALYQGLLRLHIAPHLGELGIRKITPASVRTWRQNLLESALGPSTVSKAYRLLRAVLNTAADDELIRRNPCRIKGAGVEHPAERPVLTLSEVMTLADAIDRRYRMLVLLAVFASLRWGELMGLRKTDFDLSLGLVQVERSVSLASGRQVIKKPKTPAGIRTIALPMWLLPDLEQHFADYSERTPGGRVFVGPTGVTPGRPNFSSIWARTLTKADMSGIHFHDLRHAGNHFAAISGASTRELMGRMGHVSVNAALVYQHRTASRDRAIADSLDAMVAALKAEGYDDSGHVGGTATG